MTCCRPRVVKLLKDRFSYRRKKIPFDTNLRCIDMNQKTTLVSYEKSGKCWVVKTEDLKIVEVFK